jgi:hypothetical protein
LLVIEGRATRRNVGRSRAPLLALALGGFPADVPRWGLPVTWSDPERRPELPVKISAFFITILRTFFERKALAKEAANWLKGLSNSPPHLNRCMAYDNSA